VGWREIKVKSVRFAETEDPGELGLLRGTRWNPKTDGEKSVPLSTLGCVVE